MGRTRTFIAVDVGETIRDNAIDLQRRLGRGNAGVKWVEEENIHITLLFLGEVDDVEVLDVCKAAAGVCTNVAPFSITVERLGAFPNIRRPKILWAGVRHGMEELRQLHDALEAPLLEMGAYRREERAYTPHLTLGRLNHDVRAATWAQSLAKHADWYAGETVVREVLVMGSELGRDGPVYSVLSRAQFGGLEKPQAAPRS